MLVYNTKYLTARLSEARLRRMDPVRQRSDRIVSMESHASRNLRFIRSAMESASAFTSVPGRGGVAMGLVALAAALIASLPRFAGQWLEIWIAAAATAGAIGSVAMARKARQRGQRLFGAVGRRFLLGLTPSILCAIVLTPFLSALGSAHLIAGSWLLLYGAGVVAGGMFSVRLVPIMGAVFMLLGGVCLVFPGLSPNVSMALGFGGAHIVFGALIARYYGG